jgi:hypothetical protein
MKKLLKCLLLSSLLQGYSYTKAQVNLLQDGSFELIRPNWDQFIGEGVLKKWHTFGYNYYVNNYAYFTTLTGTIDTATKLPYNSYYHTYPRHGKGTVNFLLYYKPVPMYPVGSPNVRSIVQTKLKQNLQAGRQYCVTSYVKAPYPKLYLQTNGLQFYFDNGKIDTVYTIHKDSSGIYPQYMPQVSVPFVIGDTTNWVKVQGTFVAIGTETHLTMGNFMSDTATTVVLPPWIPSLGGSCRCQEVLVDDVSVIPIDLKNWLQDEFVAIGDSVWVGLDSLDMPDAVWHQNSIKPIPILEGPGFWYKPLNNGATTFIQGIEICGNMVFDTLVVYAVPLSNNNINAKIKDLQVHPNPAKDQFAVSGIIGPKVYLLNVLGQVVKVVDVKNQNVVINVADLPKGLYTVKSNMQIKQILIE